MELISKFYYCFKTFYLLLESNFQYRNDLHELNTNKSFLFHYILIVSYSQKGKSNGTDSFSSNPVNSATCF